MPETCVAAEKIFKKAGLNKHHILVAVCMGAGAPNRCWPVERYAELLTVLLSNPDVRLLTIGALNEARSWCEIKNIARRCGHQC